MDNVQTEQQAVRAAADRAALEQVLATLSAHQLQQIATAMLALGAMPRSAP